MVKRIALVGHCNVDGPRLQEIISSGLPRYRVERVNSEADLERACNDGAELLLINREPVGFSGSGLDLIRTVRSEHPGTKVMLVSDYPDAQAQAVDAGAAPGFGKEQIGSPALIEAIEKALSA